ncbi:hypothetical protein SAMN04488105_1419 [Salipiger thiooxidans]|uniref:Uncharacterized protein n=1 Tax=Salipiger thiooxidans TaxID=282683 RepID=A0A1G7MS72_9RHOB|nr:hypothetical protein SAMN04488105_1419 [Salipiger thiooxidans]
MFGKSKECAGLEYPESFSQKEVAVRHVHCNVLRVSAVECLTGIREFLTVAVAKHYHALHPDKLRKFVASVHEWSRYVETINMTAKSFGQVSGWATNSAAYIHEPVALFDRKGICQFYGRREARGREMVDRG